MSTDYKKCARDDEDLLCQQCVTGENFLAPSPADGYGHDCYLLSDLKHDFVNLNATADALKAERDQLQEQRDRLRALVGDLLEQVVDYRPGETVLIERAEAAIASVEKGEGK